MLKRYIGILFVLGLFWLQAVSARALESGSAEQEKWSIAPFTGSTGDELDIGLLHTGDKAVAAAMLDVGFEGNQLDPVSVAVGTDAVGWSVSSELVAEGVYRVLVFRSDGGSLPQGEVAKLHVKLKSSISDAMQTSLKLLVRNEVSSDPVPVDSLWVPGVALSNVGEGAIMPNGNSTTVNFLTSPGEKSIQSSQLLANGIAVGSTLGANAFSWTPNLTAGGAVALKIAVTDTDGNVSYSPVRNVRVNTPPTLNSISDQSVYQGSSLTVALQGADADKPSDPLTYTLLEGASGSSIDSTTGIFTWSVPLSFPGGNVSVHVRVSDGLATAERTFGVNVLPLLYTVTATGIPSNGGSIQGLGNYPAGTHVTLTESVAPGFDFDHWEENGVVLGSSSSLSIDLNGNRAFTAIFKVRPNSPPFLKPIPDKTVDEETVLEFKAEASDSDIPAQQLTFALGAGAPASATIDSYSGLFHWTPAEADGPGSFPVTIIVSDNGSPQLSTSQSFVITVREVNRAPSLQPLGNISINAQGPYQWTVSATDPDLPAQKLTYTLDQNAPAWLSLSKDGLLTASPQSGAQDGTYSVTLRVTDSGTPALSDQQTIYVALDRVGPKVISINPSSAIQPPFSSFEIGFSESVVRNTVRDSVIHIQGPAGPIPVTSVTALADDRYTIAFDPQSADGTYSIKIGPTITDIAGNSMDQNANGIPGETEGDVYTATIQVESRQLGISLANNALVEGETTQGTVTYPHGLAQPLTVYLGASQPQRVLVPSAVVIPAGSQSANFTVQTVNDLIFQGDATISISASGSGLGSAQTSLLLVDDDATNISLSLTPQKVSEAAGKAAITGTLNRSVVSNSKLPVAITTDHSELIGVPAVVNIPSGQASITFPIDVIDDSIAQGTRHALIGAKMVQGNTILVQADPQSIEVLDDDGPSLALSSKVNTVREGDTAQITVSVNTPPLPNDLTVSLTSGKPADLILPPSIVIKAGATSATFNVNAQANNVQEGTRSIEVDASAAAFASAVLNLSIVDTTLPDLVVSSVVAPASAVTDSKILLTVEIKNQGVAKASGQTLNRVYLSADAYPGDDLLIGTFITNLDLDPAAATKIQTSVTLPNTATNGWIVVECDAGGAIEEINENNNSSAAPDITSIEPNYTVSLVVDLPDLPKLGVIGKAIGINGTALDKTGAPVPNAALNVYIKSPAVQRILPAKTDVSGKYHVEWAPTGADVGEVTFAAGHPAVSNPLPQDRVIVQGISISHPPSVAFDQATAGSFDLEVINSTSVATPPLNVKMLGTLTGMEVKFGAVGTFVVPGGSSIKIPVLVTPANNAPLGGTFAFSVASADGTISSTTQVPFSVRVPKAILRLAPGSLTSQLLRGAQRTVSFDVFNDGQIASEPLRILLPTDITWMSAVTASLPAVEPGKSANVSILLSPSVDEPLGRRTGTLVVKSGSDGAALSFDWAIVSDLKVSLHVDVTDEFTYYDPAKPKVSGATITVTDAITGNQAATYITGASGTYDNTDLTEGYYIISASAPDRHAYTQTVLLSPGENKIETPLLHEMVHYSWTVDPVQFEEQVKVTVNTTFETTVPAPVVEMSPNVFDVGSLKNAGDEMTIDVTLTNHGLIDAQNLKLNLTSTDYYKVEAVGIDSLLGKLAPQKSITVPVRITLVADPQAQVQAAKAKNVKAVKGPTLKAAAAASSDPCKNPSIAHVYEYWCGMWFNLGTQAVFTNLRYSIDCGGQNKYTPPYIQITSTATDNNTQTGFFGPGSGTYTPTVTTPSQGTVCPPNTEVPQFFYLGCPGDYDCDGIPDGDDPDVSGVPWSKFNQMAASHSGEEGPGSNGIQGSDPVSLYSGNEDRTIVDLETWTHIGSSLTWQRNGNSLLIPSVKRPFGNGHDWRHGYQWELLKNPSSSGTPSTIEVITPTGAIEGFRESSPGIWEKRSAALTASLIEVNGEFEFRDASANKYAFENANLNIGNAAFYRIKSSTDSSGISQGFSYDSTGNLKRVTDPAGNYLDVSWEARTYTDIKWKAIGKSVSVLPSTDRAYQYSFVGSDSYRYVRLWLPDTTIRVTRVDTIATSDGVVISPVISGDAIGDGATGKLSFENLDTDKRLPGVSSKSVLIDLGTSRSLRSFVIHVSNGPDAASTLALLQESYIEGIEKLIPTQQWVVASVASSDGRSVSYQYQTVDDAVLPGCKWLVLSGVNYGDGNPAYYTYTQTVPGLRPLIAEYEDPRYSMSFSRVRNHYLAWGIGVAPDVRYGSVVKQETLGDKPITLMTREMDSASGRYVIRYPNGGSTGIIVDPDSAKEQSTFDSLGRKTILTRSDNSKGYLTKVTDPLGHSTQFESTDLGNAKKTTYPDGTVMSWVRDGQDLPLEMHVTGPGILERVTKWTRDSSGRVTRMDRPDGRYIEFTYNAFGQPLTKRNPDGGIETFEYDSLGRLTSSTDAEGGKTIFTYNEPNSTDDFSSMQVDSITDPRGNITKLYYDFRGHLIKTVHPDGTYVTVEYDKDGNPTKTIDEVGHIQTSIYDSFGRVISKTDALGRTIYITYRADSWENKATEVKSAAGRVVHNEYDSEWQLTSSVLGYGTQLAAETKFAYDEAGNVVSTTDPLGSTTTYKYDQRNRRTTVTDAQAHSVTTTYDGASNILSVTRDDGSAISSKYDAMNRLVWTQNALGSTTAYEYGRISSGDGGDGIARLTDAAGNVYSWERDAMGRPKKKIYPDGSVESWRYDSAGNLASFTNRRGDVANYTHDSRNRETKKEWSDGVTPTVVREYLANSLVKRLDNGISTIEYEYNDSNEVLSDTQIINEIKQKNTIDFEYDKDGLVSALTYPNARKIEYTWTARSQLDQVKEGFATVAGFTYNRAGNRVEDNFGNGTKTVRRFDSIGNIIELDHRLAQGSIANYKYHYDSLNRRSSQEVKWVSGLATMAWTDTWQYDATDQLVHASLGEGGIEQNWKYDILGNRLNDKNGEVETDYTVNALNQYTKISSNGADRSPRYDSNGNLTSFPAVDGGWNYLYDAENRLIEATTVDGKRRLLLAYDGLNRQVSRKVQSRSSSSGTWRDSSTDYVIYNGWSELEDHDAVGAVVSSTVTGLGLDDVLSRTAQGNASFFHTDALGSVVMVTDSSPKANARYSYQPFGEKAKFAGDLSIAGNPERQFETSFAGSGSFEGFGISDMRSRAYVPGIGRFAQTDSIGFSGGDVNLYRYVGNSPTRLIDPMGQSASDPLARFVCGFRNQFTFGNFVIGAVVGGVLAVASPTVVAVVAVCAAVAGGVAIFQAATSNDPAYYFGQFAGGATAGGLGAGLTGGAVGSVVRGPATQAAESGMSRSAVVSAERAEQLLIKYGRTAEQAKDYVASFKGPITARIVSPGESFLRYTDVAGSKGSFLTRTRFGSPAEAVEGLYLRPYGNGASLLQDITASGRSIILEGGVANGTAQQSLIVNRNAFQFGTGARF